MARKGREFELAYKKIYELDLSKYMISSPGMVYDKVSKTTREVDILIEYCDKDGFSRKIAVECRDRKKVEDSMWIEQLITKRNDLELDYLIAVTTKNFSGGAINKAKYHGVIIETAEKFEAAIVDEVANEFSADILLFKYSITNLNFLVNGSTKSFKEVSSSASFVDRAELLNFLNKDYYFSVEVYNVWDDENFDKNLFYTNPENIKMDYSHSIYFNDKSPDVVKRLNLLGMAIDIEIIPFKVNLPLNNSLSIFDGESGKNKKFFAYFGNEDEYLKTTYVDSGRMKWELHLNERSKYRFAGMNVKLNTIFPGDISDSEINNKEIIENYAGEFDITKIL